MAPQKKIQTKKARPSNDENIEQAPKKMKEPTEKLIMSADFPIVGIGASAGGLQAFEAFFYGLAANPGMAFILVQHLSPDHKSMLTDLIRRATDLPVFEIEDGMEVKIDCVYIIPPNCHIELVNNRLRLLEFTEPRGQRHPIDFFFRSLAEVQQERAIGIVLSGTGTDGTLGLRAIKGEGGMIMAQTLESSQFSGMPESAIATGQVDYVLAPGDMPARLMAYAKYALMDNDNLKEGALTKIIALLSATVGHDFSLYKPSTIERRIERRMAIQQIITPSHYLKHLLQTPAEVRALFSDLLIGVTSFFRDSFVFEALEKIIPRLFADKPAGSTIRVWSAGCSTGEEAYSLAILLRERIEELRQDYKVQIFATDIDSESIAKARAGIYPASIVNDMTQERLTRFFSPTADQNSFRINKNIRDIMIFSEQNLIKDPPFSKIDFISCRNLLIYLNAKLQEKIIPMFHYALKPGGLLLLGASEGVGEFGNLFGVLDRKAKLYQRNDDVRSIRQAAQGPFLVPMLNFKSPNIKEEMAFPTRLPVREIAEEALLQKILQAAALVNIQGNILYLHGRTGMYLEPAPGETVINNIFKMAREGLRPALSAAFGKAVTQKEKVVVRGVNVKTNGHFTLTKFSVEPVVSASTARLDTPLYLIIFQEDIRGTASSDVLKPLPSGSSENNGLDERIAALEQELRAKEEFLESANEELQTSYEEIKTSNEEMQSINEELQSTIEELETSKEELQSVNEELATVNSELHALVVDLTRANNDMNNLLSGTGIATIFIDRQLKILRFTPTAAQIINLIPNDVGRSVGHIMLNLVGYSQLAKDAQTVLNTLIPLEKQVLTTEGAWFAMRIQPYRTLDDVIDGVVITFVDITTIKTMEESLEKANKLSRLAVVVRDSQDAITVQDLKGQTLAWNRTAQSIYGFSESEARKLNIRARIPKDLREKEWLKVQDLCQGKILKPFLTKRVAKNGSVLDVLIIASPLIDEKGKIYGIATTERLVGQPRLKNKENDDDNRE